MHFRDHSIRCARLLSRSAFTLLELLVVVSLITAFALFTAPMVQGLSKASRRYGSVTKLSRTLEQARSFSLASGNPSRVAFCDSPEVSVHYRFRSYAIFQQDPELEATLIQGAWQLLDEGCIFQPGQNGILGPDRARANFVFPAEGRSLLLPYIEFDELGRVVEPKLTDHCNVEIIEGALDGTSFRRMGESSSHRLSVTRSTGRVRISEVLDSQQAQ